MQVVCPPNAGPGQAMMIQVPMAAAPIVEAVAISPEVQQEALTIGPQDQVPLLDHETAGILAAVKSFRVNQRVKFWEAFSGGCCEQSNTYDFFDEATGTHLFIAQETSEDFLRCCCAPYHSLRVEFKRVNSASREWSSRGEIASMPTVMTVEREGCMSKPCLGCFAFSDACKDGMTMTGGGPLSEPGDLTIRDQTFAYGTQPKCGGYFTPTLNLFNRQTAGSHKESFTPLAKVEGPMCFGGCSELCCDSTFTVSSMRPEQIDSKIMSGDLAKITKLRPRGACACGKELFTDSDTFSVHYNDSVGLTPQQKAAMMGSLVLTDYMFFEQDQGMVTVEGSKIKITLFECYVRGKPRPPQPFLAPCLLPRYVPEPLHAHAHRIETCDTVLRLPLPRYAHGGYEPRRRRRRPAPQRGNATLIG